jgi:hypothetical protein
MTLLLGTAAIGFGMVGFGNGRVGRWFSALDSVYGVVLVVGLWMTIDRTIRASAWFGWAISPSRKPEIVLCVSIRPITAAYFATCCSFIDISQLHPFHKFTIDFKQTEKRRKRALNCIASIIGFLSFWRKPYTLVGV